MMHFERAKTIALLFCTFGQTAAMIVERSDNEIVVRLSASMRPSALQGILDYLRYEELTSGSTATADDADKLIALAKRGRAERVSKKLSGDAQSGS